MKFSAISMFCEDIKQDSGGADIVLCIWPDNLAPSSDFPIGLPKLSIYTRLRVELDSDPEQIEILISMGGSEERLTIMSREFVADAIEGAKNNGSPFAGLTSRTIFTGFTIDRPMRLTVKVVTPSSTIVSGSINVKDGSDESTK